MGQITMSFCGQWLRIAREFRALTQSEVAQKVSTSTALISLCEAGRNKRPSHDFVEACGAVLGFEPAFFYAPLEDVFQEDECNFPASRDYPGANKGADPRSWNTDRSCNTDVTFPASLPTH
jgi:transcriptional regulator with XRE-family HTH domain